MNSKPGMACFLLLFLTLLHYVTSASANQAMNDFLLKAAQETMAENDKPSEQHNMNWVSSWFDKVQFRFNHRNNLDNNGNSKNYELRIKPKA